MRFLPMMMSAPYFAAVSLADEEQPARHDALTLLKIGLRYYAIAGRTTLAHLRSAYHRLLPLLYELLPWRRHFATVITRRPSREQKAATPFRAAALPGAGRRLTPPAPATTLRTAPIPPLYELLGFR